MSTQGRRAAVAPANGDANKLAGNAQGNIILFEPSTSEHLSARTIFDPITALAPAADCRTFAIGYASLTYHAALCLYANSLQLPQWLHTHCHPPTLIHHLTHPYHAKIAISYGRPGLAWIVIEAKVRDAGGPDSGR